MDTIISFFHSLDIDITSLLKSAGIIFASIILLYLLGRFVFGKKSVFLQAISTTIAIIFVYFITLTLSSMGVQFEALIAPLPFVSISGNQMYFFDFSDAHYTAICSELTSLIALSFLVNLADGWLPKGKKLFECLFFRVLSVVIAYLIHLFLHWFFTHFLPMEIITYAPAILMGLLFIMLLTSVLKLVVGALLSTVNPIIGAIYTFFFANAVGKQITKAVLTAIILTVVVSLLNHFGYSVFCISSAALITYIPFTLIIFGLWFLVTKAL